MTGLASYASDRDAAAETRAELDDVAAAAFETFATAIDAWTQDAPGDTWGLARSSAEQLICDSRLLATLFAGRTKVLDANTASEQFSLSQRRAFAARDRGCVFPGCQTHPRHCDIHHLRHREHGGPTTLDNAASLCRLHHRLVDDHRWTLDDDRRWLGGDRSPWDRLDERSK